MEGYVVSLLRGTGAFRLDKSGRSDFPCFVAVVYEEVC